MPGPYGVTPTGFNPKTVEDIKAELEASFRAIFGNSIDVSAASVYGQFIGVFALALAEVWALALAVYSSAFRSGASGDALQKIGLLTNTTRRLASSTRVLCTLTGTAGTAVPANQTVSIPNGAKFRNPLGGTIGPSGVTLEFVAVETGPVFALAGTVTQIDTSLAGWAAVSNALDQFELGRNVESDSAFRARQENEIQGLGGASAASVRAQLTRVAGVSEAYVYENEGDITDANGLPPHSVECVVSGGADASIAAVVLKNKATGCATFGSTTVSTPDANGFSKSIRFSRPTTLPVWVTLNVTADISKWQAANADALRLAVVKYATDTLRVGSEVRSAAIIPTLFAANVGVLNCALPLLGFAVGPTSSATLALSNRQLALFDSSRIVVNVTLEAL
jgi:uncharacterized phage protein gp47/JayE